MASDSQRATQGYQKANTTFPNHQSAPQGAHFTEPIHL